MRIIAEETTKMGGRAARSSHSDRSATATALRLANHARRLYPSPVVRNPFGPFSSEEASFLACPRAVWILV